jgi:hypothetical protein
MTKRWILVLFLLMLSALGCGSSSSVSVLPCEPRPLRLLFVGNSLTYTNDLPGLLATLVDSAGMGPFTVSDRSRGGFGLEDHWADWRTRDAVGSGNWDLVILQQGPSATEGRPSLLEFSKKFADHARAAGTAVALYMVWPSIDRSGDFGGVFTSYLMAAKNTGSRFFPSGESWRVAWETDPDLALYGGDGFHPSRLGTYAAALVMFEQLTGCSPVGLPASLVTKRGVPYEIDPETALKPQEAAAVANERHAITGSG